MAALWILHVYFPEEFLWSDINLDMLTIVVKKKKGRVPTAVMKK